MSAEQEQWPVPDGAALDTSPVCGAIHTFPPIDVAGVSGSPLEPLWDDLMRRYHALGYRRLLGHRLKYLVWLQGRLVAALSFSAPALKLRVRDQYIGWSPEQRRAHLGRLVNNSRLLILPWVQVANLASQVLARTLACLPADWEARYGSRVWLVESFVDPTRYRGTCYRAANWQCLGSSSGHGKVGRGYRYHGVFKEVYVYVLEPRFRTFIGCTCKASPLLPRPSPFTHHGEDLRMIIRHASWHPERMPTMNLTESDVETIADELVQFHTQFQASYGRKEHRRLGLAYLAGLLSHSEAKSVEPIALALLDQAAVRSLQQFVATYRWAHEEMQAVHRRLLAELVAEPAGMLTVDSSEFPKKGHESVGVARQYCGARGKVDNCQSGVFVGYASRQGYGLLAARLYLPESWFGEAQADRRAKTRVPADLAFQTKPQIAGELLAQVAPLFPAKWIGCDATFGANWAFLDALPPGLCYFASIRATAQVFLSKPRAEVAPYRGRGRRPSRPRVRTGTPSPVSEIARSTRCTWTSVVLDEGAKGPIRAEVACVRVFPARGGLPQPSPVWLFLRRMPDGQIKYAFSNAPHDTTLAALCEAATLRWSIEQCFQEGKSQVGMDHYEHRSWPAWHRHMLYVCLALHFLLRVRLRFKKNAGAHASPSADAGRGSAPVQKADASVCPGTRALSHETELQGVPIASEETTSPSLADLRKHSL